MLDSGQVFKISAWNKCGYNSMLKPTQRQNTFRIIPVTVQTTPPPLAALILSLMEFQPRLKLNTSVYWNLSLGMKMLTAEHFSIFGQG